MHVNQNLISRYFPGYSGMKGCVEVESGDKKRLHIRVIFLSSFCEDANTRLLPAPLCPSACWSLFLKMHILKVYRHFILCTFRLCFLWRKWYGTLRQAEYFLATIAGQKNIGKIHPWRPSYTHSLDNLDAGAEQDTSHYNKHPNTNISIACDHIYMFTQYHDPSPGRTWTLFPHYSVIVLISMYINIHNICLRSKPGSPNDVS